MLGFEVYITPEMNIKAYELKFTIGWQGLSWIRDREREGIFHNIGDGHGYPYLFKLTWSQVIEWLATRTAGDSGSLVLDDEGGVSSANAQGHVVFDVAKFKPDEPMLVEAWDLS